MSALSAGALPFARAAVEAPDQALVEREGQIKASSEAKIQKDILDPILGLGKAMVFVDVELDQITQREESGKQGVGLQQNYKEKAGTTGANSLGLNSDPNSQFILPGVPQPKFLSRLGRPGGGSPPEQATQQQAAQAKEVTEEKLSVKTLVRKFGVTIIHDETVPKAKLDLVRERIIDAFKKYEVAADKVVFRPTKFVSTWWDQLRDPKVYVPLTFAMLLLLFLLYLFGPFTLLLNGLVKAMKEKGATEVKVDSTFEQGQQQPQMAMASMEGEMGGEFGRKKEEEEEEMKKFEPFAYINEENVKRLAYLLRHEEPWVAAVVLAYLKPEFAHHILAAMPLELQARVAIETATIRQLTRDQVIAIDEQIKEKVNFVLGGVGHLVQMIEDSDEATRQNLLEYLKNEKPAVYEKIRRAVLLFDDVPNFPDRDVQSVIRSLKTENMARALVGAHPDVAAKFLANMSTGAASLLKEEMEYTRDLTPAQVEEERRKIMTVIKSLENEGKIHIREKLDDFALEGLEEGPMGAGSRPGKIALPGSSSPASTGPTTLATSAPDPQRARPLMADGVAQFQAGRYAEALALMAEALRLDPELWQAYSMMGYAAYAAGRVQEAVSYYERFYERNPDPALRTWLDGLKASIEKDR